MDRRFRILSARVELSGPDEVVAPIAAAYRRFRVADGPGGDWTRVALVAGDPGRVVVEGARELPVPAGVDPTLLLYQQFLFAAMNGIGDRIVLHAASLVDRAGRAFLIAAPSGLGKSSLTLRLLDRGHGFLSDDYAPLDPANGTIAPYPRSIGLLPGRDASVPRRFRERAADPATPALFGKRLIDAEDALGPGRVAGEPLPMGTVFLMEPGGDAPTTKVEFGAETRDAEALERRVRAIDGVRVVDTRDRGGVREWTVELDHRRQPTGPFADLMEDDAVLYSEKHWGRRPRFGAEPRLEPLSRLAAARLLGREILNRRPGGALLQRLGGDLTALFFELAGALAGVRCYRLHPGPLAETAERIEGALQAPAAD